MKAIDVAAYIGGSPRQLPAELEQLNPADQSDVAVCLPACGTSEVAEAAEAATLALRRPFGIEARSDALDRVGHLIAANRDRLASLIVRETGKTILDAEAEVGRASRIFRFYSGEALRIAGESLDSVRTGVSVLVNHMPLGVVAAITPWNFPIAIPAWKIAPALAYGNAIVWKPSEHASATGAALMDLLLEAGFRDGWINFVPGAGETGRLVTTNPLVSAVTFTGSAATGKSVIASAAASGARVQAEMGGVNAALVLDDADIDAAVSSILNGAWFSAGQRCTATSRILVQSGIREAFQRKLAEAVLSLRVGDPAERTTQVGPLISTRQQQTVKMAIERMRDAGRTIVSPELAASRGTYVAPSLVADAVATDVVMSDEVFGPVAGMMSVDDYEDGLSTLNNNSYGLCAGLYTRSIARAEHFRRHARAGMIMVNLPTAGVDYHVPFGGVGNSSYGHREQGRAAREFFTLSRTTYLNPV